MTRRALVGLRTGASVAVAIACIASARAQQSSAPQEPTFRAATRPVPVYVTVTDDLGRVVLDLKRDDFEIRDDGKVQEISQFTKDLLPLTAVVLLDGSRSMVKALDTVVTAADHFVVRLMPGDRARVGSFSDEIRFAPMFSNNRDELAREVNDEFDLRIGFGTRLWDAIGQAIGAMGGITGRRVVVVFSDGLDTSSTTSVDDARARARNANVMVYAVLIRGLEPLAEEVKSGHHPSSEDFADLALSTGGGYYLVDNVLDDMNSITTEIAEELHNQYVVAFLPQQLDGKVHRLDVRVKRPGVKVRARGSYIATPEN